jgi:hypothetical protein
MEAEFSENATENVKISLFFIIIHVDKNSVFKRLLLGLVRNENVR